MSYAEYALPEFDHEMASTRKVLERIPDNKLDWKAHPKSNTIGWNANHLADLPGWALDPHATRLRLRPARWPALPNAVVQNDKEILELFDRNIASARKALAAVKDESMNDMWTSAAANA